MEEKREQKYMQKFGYRVKQISKNCNSGLRMGTPAPLLTNGIRAISKYLKRDEVSVSQTQLSIGKTKPFCDSQHWHYA